MEKKLKIYISLPISGHSLTCRRSLADTIAASLSRQGYEPVNPFNIYAGKHPDYYDHICADLRVLADCDAIFFCYGWEQSCGCCIEHDFVQRCIAHDKKNYKIYYQ